MARKTIAALEDEIRRLDGVVAETKEHWNANANELMDELEKERKKSGALIMELNASHKRVLALEREVAEGKRINTQLATQIGTLGAMVTAAVRPTTQGPSTAGPGLGLLNFMFGPMICDDPECSDAPRPHIHPGGD